MICPKCGFEQPESLDGARCGIVFSRYKGAAAGARPETPPPFAPPPLPPLPQASAQPPWPPPPPLMPPAASVLRTRLDSMFLEHGLAPPQNIIETASLPVIIHLLRHSDLLTALPPESVGPYVQTAQMQVLPIELGVRMEFFGIIRRRDHMLSPGAERVLEALRETARRIYPGLAH